MTELPCKMKPKPKSAPGGRTALQARLAKSQSDAMKEMQAWARRAEEPGACCPVTRMSGQLTDNVTEERLLRAKLWELSKERYKFLLQNTYEKKLFADHMQRKTQAMLKARANSAAAIRSSAQAKPRPLTTSAINRPGPYPSSTISSQSLTTPRSGQERLLNSFMKNPKSTMTLAINDDEQESGAEYVLRSPRNFLTQCESNAWSDDFVKHDSQNVEGVSDDNSYSKDNSDEHSQMREVERKWVMSEGRGKVTPAATAISIPPPAFPADNDDRMVLAPLEHTAATTAVAVSQEKDHLKAAHAPPLPTNPRNLQFARLRQKKWAEAQRVQQRQNGHANASSQPSDVLNTTSVSSSKTVPTMHLSGSPKPTSASSKRSAPSSSTAAVTTNFLSPKRGLLHRYGSKIESKTSDPRYTRLQHSLIPMTHSCTHPDVRTIVQSFDALNVQPKLRKEVKPTTGLKALSYMNERGFVF